MHAGLDFEPEIAFPSEPFNAARVYLGAMAYPESGAGQPGGHGAAFAEAMWSRVMWSRRKAKGLAQVRAEHGDPAYSPPQLRAFEGIYHRGTRRLKRRDVEGWAKRLGLNDTGPAADPEQKAKDLVRRAYLQSRPVLHMVHGLERAIDALDAPLPGWDGGDNILVLLVNADRWVWTAIDHAETWRALSRHHFTPGLSPDKMIALTAEKPAR